MTMTIERFCDKHYACENGREWALSCGATTMQELWTHKDLKHEWRLWIAMKPGVFSDRDLRLFGCWCVRQVWHLLTDERSRKAVEIAELFADGKASQAELDAAWAAAWDDAGAAESARAAATAAARSAAWVAGAAWDAARSAAWSAVRDAQDIRLLELTPNFEE